MLDLRDGVLRRVLRLPAAAPAAAAGAADDDAAYCAESGSEEERRMTQLGGVDGSSR